MNNSDELLIRRMARCAICRREIESNWDLPLFEYCGPGTRNHEHDCDFFYCGCPRWDTDCTE